MPLAGNIAKTMTSNGKQFTITREMLTAVARDQRWPGVVAGGTREKRSAHACLPCFRREFAIEIIRDKKNKLDSGREIKKSKLHTQKISFEFHEHKVY